MTDWHSTRQTLAVRSRISWWWTMTSGCARCCTRYLSGNGFRVSAAAQAAEARALMKSMAFDCLILDVMMPGESGLELAKRVRERFAGSHPDADGAGRSRRPHRRAGTGRGRLSAQAVRAARTAAARSTPCCAGPRRWQEAPAASGEDGHGAVRSRRVAPDQAPASRCKLTSAEARAAAIVRRQCRPCLFRAAIFAPGWAWRWNARSMCR